MIVHLDDNSDNLERGSDGVISQLVIFAVGNGQSVNKDNVENFLVNSAVTTVIVNGGVNQLLGAVQLAASGSADIVDSCGDVVVAPVVSETTN